MHILVTGLTANRGGVESFIMNYYRRLRLLDPTLQFTFLTTAQHPAFEDEIIALGGRIIHIPRSRERAKRKAEIKELLSNTDYDILWSHKCELSDPGIIKLAKSHGVPKIVLHSHNSANMFEGLSRLAVQVLHPYYRRTISRYVTDYWACSDYAAKWMFPSEVLDQNKYVFIPNAIDAAKFRFNADVRKSCRESLHIGDTLVVGAVGRLSYQKNPEMTLHIFNCLYAKNKDTVLLMIGTGELEAKVKQLAASLPCKDHIHFLGMRSDIPELMQAMDCLLLPSVFEGLPVVAIEAQAAGLPVVAASDGISRMTKILDTFKFLSLSDSYEKWAACILESANPNERDTFSTILQNGFDIESASRKLLKLLKQQ